MKLIVLSTTVMFTVPACTRLLSCYLLMVLSFSMWFQTGVKTTNDETSALHRVETYHILILNVARCSKFATLCIFSSVHSALTVLSV
jgi:hypothetical protein